MVSANRARQDPYAAGLAAAGDGHHAAAIAHFEAALQAEPGDVRVLFALGNTAAAIGHADAAETFFHRVLAQDPDRVEVLVNLANLLRKRGRTADAIALLAPALERNPSGAELWLTLGSALREAGDATTAELFYREALRLLPESAAALGNLADLLADTGAVEEGLALYERALALEPGNAQARLNRAILLLLKGDLRQGFRDYESRLKIKERLIIADHGLPAWSGEPIAGMRLLVTAEQGIGDQIMFASLIPELAQTLAVRGGRVILECETRLVALLARSFPSVSVHAAQMEARGGRTFAHYDWLKTCGGADAAIAIGSLPGMMRNELARFPAPHAYLKPDAQEQAQWAHWLRGESKARPIGICWRSGSLGGLRNLQYAPLQAWAAFIRELPGTPVSLQYDLRVEEIDALQQLSGRAILVPPKLDQKQEIDRTAGMISALDAVVSSPTSVSWIAAGLGVPTFKILYNTGWTALGSSHEPFAPSARCLVPKTGGDWADGFAKAAGALIAMPPRA